MIRRPQRSTPYTTLFRSPWEGGKKAYSDRIFVFERSGRELIEAKETTMNLPEPIAYCGSVSTEYGIVYAGGESEQGLSRSEEHTSELQSRPHLVCRLLLE